jgi:putative membrane protein
MKTKVFVIALLAVLLIIFVLQNTEMVIINLFFWDLSIPRALLVFVCFAMGLVIGLLIPSSGKSEQEVPEKGNI